MLIPLLQNVSMLMAVVVIYALITSRHTGYLLRSRQGEVGVQVLTGVATGLIAITMILTPVRYAGLLLDGRSVLLSLTALFFGPIPAAITLAIAMAYRIHTGGPGVAPAFLVMSSSVLIGLAWRRLRKPVMEQLSLAELYLFGFAVHLAILALAFFTPPRLLLSPLTGIAVPLLIVFPMAELVIGGLLVRFLRQEIRAEDIKESEERYRLLADSVTDIILRNDLDWRIDYVSPSVRQLGYRPEDLIGGIRLNFTHPDDTATLHKRLRDVSQGLPCGSFEARVRKADGDWVWMESNPAAIRDEDGRIVGVLSILRDVTARRQAETALREARAELARGARISALGAFGASVAHEVNQPLAALVMNSDVALRMLAADPPNLAMVQRVLTRSARDAQRASEIITRMRAMITRGSSDATDFDINEAVREVLALIEGEIQRWNVTVETDLSGDLPPIHGDRIQMQQVILNLIQNAIEAMRSTPERERLLAIRSAVIEDGSVLVEIEDRGPGLDPASADQLFERLFSTKEGGTGLGLAISKSIIEAHGGRIWAEAAEPRGALFQFQIPPADGD